MTYDLFGLDVPSLEEGRELVESALGLELDPHESGYAGGDYYRFGRSGEENIVMGLWLFWPENPAKRASLISHLNIPRGSKVLKLRVGLEESLEARLPSLCLRLLRLSLERFLPTALRLE